MRTNNRLIFITILGVFLILVFGIWQELSMSFNDDVAYAILTLQGLLQGKHYFTDFINTNSPLAFYIYLPVLFIHKLFHFNIFLSHKLYMYSIVICSLFFSNYLFGKLISNRDSLLKYVLFISIAFSFIILPQYEFGQRSHIAIMLIFPYLVLIMLRLKNITAKPSVNMLIGVGAGIGFALNPFYLPLFFCCEIIRMIKKKSNVAWLTPEIVIILFIQIAYFIFVLRFYPNYFYKIIPLGYHVYLPGYAKNFIQLLKYPYAAFSVITLIISTLLYRFCREREISLIFIISNICFLLSYFLQRKIFYYHVLPVMTIATLQACYLMFELISQFKGETSCFSKGDKLFILFIVAVLFVSIPVFLTFYLSFWLNKNRENTFLPFVKFISSLPQPNQKISFFTFYPSLLYTAAYTTKTQVASRFDGFWFFPAMIKYPYKYSVQKYKSELIDMVVNDLKDMRPNYIFVDQGKTKSYFGHVTFHYLKFFNQSKSFKLAFSHYAYFKTFRGFKIYKRKYD